MLFLHGAPLRNFYVLTNGAVRIFRQTPSGREVTINLSGRGDIVGASHIYESCKTYQWSAITIEETTAIEYPIAWFRKQLDPDNPLARNMLKVLSQQSHSAAIRAEQLVTFTAAQRLCCFLMRLCTIHNLDYRNFHLPLNKTTITSKLGMALETFSRTAVKLKPQGVRIKASSVSVADPGALSNYMCSHCSIMLDCETAKILQGDQEHRKRADLSQVDALELECRGRIKQAEDYLKMTIKMMEDNPNCEDVVHHLQTVTDILSTTKHEYVQDHLQHFLLVIQKEKDGKEKAKAVRTFNEIIRYR